MKKTEQESFYEVHLNKNDEMMISLRAREGSPSAPVLIYDGGPHALLYRTPESSVLLDYLHPEVRPYLSSAKEILIVETKDFAVIREYCVTCRVVKNLPIEHAGVKPLLEKEEAKKIDERKLYQ